MLAIRNEAFETMFAASCDDVVSATDTELGLDLSGDDFLFLCHYSGDITLTVTADATNLLSEVNEDNNVVHLTHLRIDIQPCTGEWSLVVTLETCCYGYLCVTKRILNQSLL